MTTHHRWAAILGSGFLILDVARGAGGLVLAVQGPAAVDSTVVCAHAAELEGVDDLRPQRL